MRTNAANTDLSDILPEEIESKVKELAEVSMGTEIADEDMLNINHLCKNVLELQEYRSQLFEYLKNRMMAIAPNLTILVGELVGARLISHAGSLINLAKHPASTVQILGAEKALFRALKTHHDTPKYGLLYHAQLIGQSNPKFKGKMSRMLAAKASLATRFDALGEETNNDLGTEHRAKLEARLKFLEEGGLRSISGSGKRKARIDKYEHKSQVHTYKAAADSTLAHSGKRKFEETAEEELEETIKIKTEESEETPVKEPKKKKKKSKIVEESEPIEEDIKEEPTEPSPKKVKKEKKSKAIKEEEPEEEPEEVPESQSGSKKKKKKKKTQD
jgi:nucleolar protein 58